MTKERVQEITEALMQDKVRAEELLKMSAEDAAKAFSESGYDFTEEELQEMGEMLVKSSENIDEDGELNAEALDDVAGGSILGGLLVLGAAAGVAWIGGKILKKKVIDPINNNKSTSSGTTCVTCR